MAENMKPHGRPIAHHIGHLNSGREIDPRRFYDFLPPETPTANSKNRYQFFLMFILILHASDSARSVRQQIQQKTNWDIR
jgi:hypothetical protein